VARVAAELLHAEASRADRGRITTDWPGLDVAAAYEAQDALIQLKVDAGERVIGIKLGLTSRAKQQRMGISSPLTGVLTDGMLLEAGVPVPLGELIHPRVEPEIVFVMGARLAGPGVTAATALAAVASVHAGLEVIDSRFRDFDFALPDVVADNASSSRFVVGATGSSPLGLDLVLEACVLRRNGEVVDTATGAAVQGNPAEALALAANALAERGGFIEAGSIVLTGGMTDAIFVSSGDVVSVDFTTLGSIALPVSAAPERAAPVSGAPVSTAPVSTAPVSKENTP
jgi:2-oxo-3-hexenedioate decarboxylase